MARKDRRTFLWLGETPGLIYHTRVWSERRCDGLVWTCMCTRNRLNVPTGRLPKQRRFELRRFKPTPCACTKFGGV